MATETGPAEKDPQHLYPAISEEGSTEVQTAEWQRQQEEWRTELKSTEEDIVTLRQLLDSKLRRSAELRRKLGLTPMAEIRHDFQEGLKAVRELPAVQKTNTTLRSWGAVMSQKFTDLKNSPTMSAMSTKVGSTYTNVKDKMARSATIDFISARQGPQNEANGGTNGTTEPAATTVATESAAPTGNDQPSS